MQDKLIGFIGQGWIGKNYADDFEKRGLRVVRYGLEEPYVKNKEKIKDCDIVFIAVPTPSTPEGFDDSILREAIGNVGEGKTAVIKSTLLPGRTESIQKDFPGVFVMHSPEFLTEATASYDAANPDRNIVGLPAMNDEYKDRARQVIEVLPKAPFEQICSSREAELIKYGGNNWFYFKVIYANMLYDLATQFGARYEEVKKGMSHDSRIGNSHLDPIHKSGRGAGGNCFIKDFSAFTEMYEKEVGDQLGINVLHSLRDKNIDLLVESNKDLELLHGVYGDMVPKPKLNVLITGGAGFIGSHTAKALLERGDEVVIIDNFSDSYDSELKKDRVRNLMKKFEKVKVVKADISDLETMEKVFEKYKPNKVVNLATTGDARYSVDNPFVCQKTNIQGFINILELCKRNGIKDIVFASSSSVYGGNKKMPFSEIDRVDIPISLYAATKKSNEEMAYTYHHQFGLNCTGLRYFTVYGPWGRPDMGVFKFLEKTFEGNPIDLYNNGEMIRDFTYIDDVVDGTIAAIDNPFPYEIFNIAKGESVKSVSFIEEIEKCLGKKAEKNMMLIQPGDVEATSADISKAKRMLNFKPQISVQSGIKKFVEWYIDYYKKF